jgi:lipopolysaccharide transport system ATP-binding protein
MVTISEQPMVTVLERQDDIVLSVDRVSKKFCRDLKRSLFYGLQDIATDLVGLRENNEKLRLQEFWATDNVSFQLRRGEALGLVGKNGSGKSTLLRLIAGLIKPDIGTVEVKGRLAPLIALGAGFNPVLTGRENVYANMSILGLTQQEIKERFDDVVAFSEIGEAVDSPVQNYSSGMAARLGFASAIHTYPDILLIDEVLAVGDAKFRTKCYRHLAKLRERGTSFILVSHNALSIMAICDTAIYLNHGKLKLSGEAKYVVGKYEEELFSSENGSAQKKSGGELLIPILPMNSGLQIHTLSFRNPQGKILSGLVTGEPASLWVKGIAYEEILGVSLSLLVKSLSEENSDVLALKSEDDKQKFDIPPGEFLLQFQMPYCGLRAGVYSIKTGLYSGRYFNVLDIVDIYVFSVESRSDMNQCMFYQPRQWTFQGGENLIGN